MKLAGLARYENNEMSTVTGIGIDTGSGIVRNCGGRPPALLHAHAWRAAEGEIESLAPSFDAFATPFDASSTRDALALSPSQWRF